MAIILEGSPNKVTQFMDEFRKRFLLAKAKRILLIFWQPRRKNVIVGIIKCKKFVAKSSEIKFLAIPASCSVLLGDSEIPNKSQGIQDVFALVEFSDIQVAVVH